MYVYKYIVLRKTDMVAEGNVAKDVQLMLEGMTADNYFKRH